MESTLAPVTCLSVLQSKFSRFRSHRRGRSRIPRELREAVVMAIAGGMEIRALASALRLSKGQIELWQRQASCLPQVSARILEIVPDKPPGLKISFEAGKLLLELSF